MASSRATLGPSSSYQPSLSSTSTNVGHDGGPLSVADQLMQLDLAITSTLQEIDANFARAHQVVTAQLLPAVKVYGQHSVKTWQSAKFWQDFFITAAQVPLNRTEQGELSQGYDANDQSGYGDHSGSTQRDDSPAYDQSNSQNDSPLIRGEVGRAQGARKGRRINDSQADESLDEADLYRSARDARASPAAQNDPEASWASVDSIFDRLRKEVAAKPVDGSLSRAENRLAQHRASKDARDRDLIAQRSDNGDDAAAKHPNDFVESAKGLTISKGKSAVPQPSIRSPAKLHHGTPKLLNKVLNAEQRKLDGKQRPATTSESKRNPFESNGSGSSKWNGIADLRETPLATNKTRSKGGVGAAKGAGAGGAVSTPRHTSRKAWYDDSDDSIALPAGMSPPVTMQFSVARSRYDKTPAKEAARHIVADVLRTCEGPSTVARDRQRLLQQQRQTSKDLNPSSPGTYLRAGKNGIMASNSVVASPLRRGPAGGPQKRRDSIPTPPTLTKMFNNKTPAGAGGGALPGSAASSAAASGHRAARLFDEGEEGGEDADELAQLQAGPASGSFISAHSRADSPDDDSDEDEDSFSSSSDEDDPRPSTSVQSSVSKNLSTFSNTNTNISTTSSSLSRSGWSSSSGASGAVGGRGASMDNDTLFGVGKLSTRTGAGAGSGTGAGGVGGGDSHGGAGGFRMIGGQVEDTVQGGKLLDDEKDLTYSAPSPTPWK